MTYYKKEIAHLARKYRIQLIYAFGSRAKGVFYKVEGKPYTEVEDLQKSDVDIGIKPQFSLNVQQKVAISIFFEDLLDVSRVDVVSLIDAPVFVALEIVEGELLYAVNDTFEAEYQLYIMRLADELLPYERQKQALIMGK